MKSSEIRVLSLGEIQTRLSDTRNEMMNLRFQVVTGQLTDTSRLRETRHDVARLETILCERLRAESAPQSGSTEGEA